MRKKMTFLITLEILLFILFSSRMVSAAGIDLCDGQLHIGGFYELLLGVHVTDPPPDRVVGPDNQPWREPGNPSLFRNTFQAEITYNFSDHVKAFTTIRYFYDGLFDLNDDINKMPASRLRSPQYGQDYLREFYIDLDYPTWHARIGKQQLVWGESDALRMADIINPLDLSWHWSLESWQDIRIPLRMIDFHYTGFNWHHLDLELVWIPEDFQSTKLPPQNAQMSIPGLAQSSIDLISQKSPDTGDISNSEFGFQTKATFGRAEYGLFYFYGRNRGSIFKLSPTYQPVVEFQRMNTIGGTVNYFEEYTQAVLRAEWALNIGMKFSPWELVSFSKEGLPVTSNFTQSNNLGFMLGFDRPVWIKFLNKNNTFSFSGQYFRSQLLNNWHNITTSTQSQDRTQNVFSLMIMSSWYHEYIQPHLLMVYDPSGTEYVQPEIKYVPSDYFNIALGANLFASINYRDSVWGAIHKGNEIYLRIRFPL